MTAFPGTRSLLKAGQAGRRGEVLDTLTPPFACTNENDYSLRTSGQVDPKSRRLSRLQVAAALHSIHAHPNKKIEWRIE